MQETADIDIEQIVQDLALRVEEKRQQCEAMYADGRINDAAQHLLEIIDTMDLFSPPRRPWR